MEKVERIGYPLKSGKIVYDDELCVVEDYDAAMELISINLSLYKELSRAMRRNPKLLAEAINLYRPTNIYCYDPIGADTFVFGSGNPICYALDEAITPQNIDAAIKKGGIRITGKNAISRSKEFVLASLNSSYPEYQVLKEMQKLPTSMKVDNEVSTLISSRRANSGRLPSCLDSKMRRSYTMIIVLPDGKFIKRDVILNTPYSLNNKSTIIQMMNEFKNDLPNHEECHVFDDVADLDIISQGEQARMCTEKGILVIDCFTRACHIYFPKHLSESQFKILVDLVTEDYGTKNFELEYDGNLCTYWVDQLENGSCSMRNIYALDVLNYMKDNEMYPNTLDTYVPTLRSDK